MTEPNSIVSMEERTWLAQHVRGDKKAFPKLMQAYRKPVYSYLHRYGLDSATCDDTFQNIFIKIHRAAASYDSTRPLGPWIFTIVVNTVRNLQRSEKGQHSSEALEELADPSARPDQSVHFERLLDCLNKLIPALPSPRKEALILSALHGMPLKDIARILDLPLNTVKTHIHRARQTLTEALSQEDLGSESMGIKGESHEQM